MVKKRIRLIQDNLVLVVLIIFLIVQTLSFFSPADVWWDSSVYIGMGKFIYSFGEAGLWEASRPIVWPVILGFFWKFHLDQIFFGKLTLLLFSLACILLTYLIAKRSFNATIGLLSAIFLAFSQTFFLFATVLHAEIPSLFFTLLGLYLFIKKKYSISGLFFGIAFMTRFFSIFAVLPIFSYLVFKSIKEKKKSLDLFIFSIYLLMPVALFLALNKFLYDNILYPFVLQLYMAKNTGFVFYQLFYFYFFGLIKENMFAVFSILGIVYILLRKNNLQVLLFFIFLFAFIPFSLAAHKEMRFLLLSLPLLYVLTAYGLTNFLSLFGKKQKIILCSVILLWFLYTAPQLKFNQYDDGFNAFYDYIKNTRIGDQLWISNPAFIVYSDYKASLLYYPAFNLDKIQELETKILGAKHVLINSCDLYCEPYFKDCEERKADFIGFLKTKFKIVFYEKKEECENYIFRK